MYCRLNMTHNVLSVSGVAPPVRVGEKFDPFSNLVIDGNVTLL